MIAVEEELESNLKQAGFEEEIDILKQQAEEASDDVNETIKNVRSVYCKENCI